MFRKILIAVVASLALLAPLALPAVSDAGPRVVQRYEHSHVYQHRYEVFYRCGNAPWRCAGSYSCRDDALRQVEFYRCHGDQAYLR